MLEVARLEQRRVNLINGYKQADKARAAYERKRAAVVKAEKAEQARAKKAQQTIKDLRKEANAAHSMLAAAEQCGRALVNEYVDRKLIMARDRAQAKSSRLARELRSARGLAQQQRDIMKRKSAKTIQGVIYDTKGRPMREDPDPLRPHVAPKPKVGTVKNPQFWKSDEEKAQYQKALDALELKEAEAQGQYEQAQKEYQDAQNALDDAIDAVSNA